MGSLFWLHKLVGTQCLRETFQMEQRSEGFHFVRCYGPVTVLEVDEDVTDRFTVKITLANGYHGGFVLVQDLDGFVDGFFDDKMDDFVVGLKNEDRSVMGLDDSVIVVL